MNNPFAQPWFSLWSDTTSSWANQAFAPNTPPSAEAMWKQLNQTWQEMLGQVQTRATMSQAEQMTKQAMSQMQQWFGQFDGQASVTEMANAWRSLFEQAGNHNALWEMLPNYWRQQHQEMQQQQQWLDAQIKPWLSQWQQHLNMPALGLYREHQEQWVALMQSHVQSQEKAKAFQDVMQQATEQAFAMFEDQLAAHAEPGRQLSSLRAVYDVWIDSAEEAFADVASSKEYQQAYGEMVDAQMRAKQQLQAQVSQWASSLGMPTRDEVDSTHKRVHELMRQMHAMTQEINALKKQLAEQTMDDTPQKAVKTSQSTTKKPVTKTAAKASSKVNKVTKKVVKKSSKKGVKKSTAKKAVAKKPAAKKVAQKASIKKAAKKVAKKVSKTAKVAKKTNKPVIKSATKKASAAKKIAVRKSSVKKTTNRKTARKTALKTSPKAAI